jgi:hypothetical protein
LSTQAGDSAVVAAQQAGQGEEAVLAHEAGFSAKDSAPSDNKSYPRGLTNDGLVEFRKFSLEHTARYESRLERELTRLWIEQDGEGPEVHPWSHVQEADKRLQERDRRTVVDAERPKIRTEVVAELQAAHTANQRVLRHARYRWYAGSTLTTATATTIATMALPTTNLITKCVLVIASVAGVVITRPRA